MLRSFKNKKCVPKCVPQSKNTRKTQCLSGVFMVEARGIEPLSENLFIQLSPDAVYRLDFPSPDAGRQALVRVAIFCVIPSIANGGCTVIADLTPERRPRYSCGGRAAQRQRQQPLGCQSNVRVVVCFLSWSSFKRLPQRYPLTVCQNPRRNHCAPISGDAGMHRRWVTVIYAFILQQKESLSRTWNKRMLQQNNR